MRTAASVGGEVGAPARVIGRRWIEYSGSASVMVMSIAFSLGMREETILTCFFVMTWVTMMLGFTNELYSRPRSYIDATVYPIGIGPDGRRREDLVSEAMALKLISGDAWEGDRPQLDAAGGKLPFGAELETAQRQLNYIRRMWPHFLGWVPFLTVWILLVKFFVTSIDDIRQFRNDPDANLPDWVGIALLGTLVLYVSFAPVQAIYQYMPPGHYWGSELLYLTLSLVSKVYLGLFLLLNVIMADEVVAPDFQTTG